MDCLFCKIAQKQIPANLLYEDENVIAFYDIAPQAPVHFLVIPRTHLTSVDDITKENSVLVAHIFEVIAKLANDLNLEQGYRVVTNCGKDGGQSVPHLHFHALAKRSLAWPPG